MRKKKITEFWGNLLYRRILLVLLSAGILAAVVYLADNTRQLSRDEEGNPALARNQQGDGAREEELNVTAGEMEESLTVEVQEQESTQEQSQRMLQAAEDQLESLILGENESLDEVQYDLKLITEISESGIRIFWELDRYDVMNQQGMLQRENLTDEGTLVKLTALLQYQEEKRMVEFYARVYPPVLGQKEKFLKNLDEELERLDEETREEKYYRLPSVIDGETVEWNYGKNYRAAGILLLGTVLALFLCVSEKEKQKEQKKKREMQLMLDYPQIVNQFTLYLGAGMTARKAWRRIVEDYESKKEEKGRREAYEEMAYTMHEMQGGGSEGECYERFGERCAVSAYKKFGTMLSQNLKKGTKGLAALLKQEADHAFEERKSLAKRLGEEAGTKMLIPMFLMLLVVLVMIVVPAFLSIQI